MRRLLLALLVLAGCSTAPRFTYQRERLVTSFGYGYETVCTITVRVDSRGEQLPCIAFWTGACSVEETTPVCNPVQ